MEKNGPSKTEKIMVIASKRGFFYPSAEIYGAKAGFWTYGHLGTRIKHRWENLWRDAFLGLSPDYFEIDDYIFSSGRPVKIEIEINPSSFSLTPLSADKIVFGSVTGEIKRFKGEMGELVDTGSLQNSQLEIRSFSGYIKLDEQGSMILHGLTNSVKGDTFNFV